MKNLAWYLFYCITILLSLDVYGALPAFPGAEGFGAASIGGRGGKVIYVTNLNDSGSGSLRAAVESSGARTVIFRVGGTIVLQNGLVAKNSKITIAGHTAPGDGITLRLDSKVDAAALAIETSDVIIRHIRIRVGPGDGRTCCRDAIVLGEREYRPSHYRSCVY